MIEPILHELSKRDISAYLQNPSQAVAIAGATGAGKTLVAKYIAAKLLQSHNLETYPYFIHIQPDEKQSIDIERARGAIAELKLKTTGEHAIRRILLIEDAHRLRVDAQNTLLKTIEEPPEDTVVMLTIADRSLLLPTVLSRLQVLTLKTPKVSEVATDFTDQGYEEAAVKKALLLSGGLPGLTHAIVTNNENHPLINAIATAKKLLSADQFERLIQIDAITNDKSAPLIVQAMSHIAEAGLQANAMKRNEAALKTWSNILFHTTTASKQLRQNTQAKLVLANLFLHV
jgi:replication-associated recombination protein RarA